MKLRKNSPSKVRYFSKIEDIFIIALASQTVKTVKFTISNVAYRPTVNKTGHDRFLFDAHFSCQARLQNVLRLHYVGEKKIPN